ncbi:putative molybdenum cofactor guanylyltransferase [Clostridia bacterium]|nr:putative molybdenum cofactor guanylyltransferase [Clostridia bacterium]
MTNMNANNTMTSGVIILAGGHSKRMGRPKHSLMCGKRRFIDVLYEKAARIGPVFVSANETIDEYDCIPDQYGDVGPLGGIATCMAVSDCVKHLVLPIDAPRITDEIIRALLSEAERGDWDCLMPVVGGVIEPLPCVFDRRTLPALLRLIAEKRLSLRAAAESLQTGHLIIDADPAYLRGVNTPEEYADGIKLIN